MRDVFSTGLGVLVALCIVIGIVYLYLRDITQKKHAILRNYPLIGHLRYFFEELGEYFRQYFFLGDRDERPFNRSTRAWVYNMAKGQGLIRRRPQTVVQPYGAINGRAHKCSNSLFRWSAALI